MNTFVKLSAACFMVIATMSFATLKSQDMTELKVVNGTKEQSGIKVVIAVKDSDSDAPMVAKVLNLDSFGDFNLFEIPSAEQIIVGAVSKDSSIEEMDTLSSEYVDKFQPISLESAKSCNVTAKGNLTEGVNFTLSNIKW